MFDEYEPWHLKCSHYTVISATQGDFLTNLARDLYHRVNRIPELLESQHLPECVEGSDSMLINVRSFEFPLGIRYGHRTLLVGSRLFVIGGFGEMVDDASGIHMRHNSIEILDLDTMNISVLKSIKFGNYFGKMCIMIINREFFENTFPLS